MRILFMGTPDFAVPSLKALVAAGQEVCGVFCQPDKGVGRHQAKLQPPPVKVAAMAHGIPVYQPVKLRDGSAMELIRQLDPELVVVAAYGRLLPDDILAYPAKGCINVHSSLLPSYRGAAPINWAILNGECETGVTIMYMASEMDTGDIIAQRKTVIGAEDTAPSLFVRLADLGAELLTEVLPQLDAGTAPRTPQDGTKATLAPMLSRELSPMDFRRSAQALHNQVRGLLPWPAAATELAGTRCKVFSTAVLDDKTDAVPGTILSADQRGICIACGERSVLRIDELQADGGRRMKAADYLRGHPIKMN